MIRSREYHQKKAEEYMKTLSLEQKLLVIRGTMEERIRGGVLPFETGGEIAHGVQARHDQSFDLGTPVDTTVFPNPIGLAATFDKELMHELGELAGIEARSLYVQKKSEALCMFGPTIDMERDPRWGRNEEAYGEDPHLSSRMAGEYILGLAGDDPEYIRCGAMLKHFYANNRENNRSTSHSNVSEHLRDTYYIHVFEETIDYSDPLSVMASYNYVNDVANTFNPEITTRLKDRGVVFISGDGGVIGLAVTKQKEAENMTDAIVRAIHAGMDSFPEDPAAVRAALEEALSTGKITEEELDEILLNRLTAYSMLGILNPERDPFPEEIYNMSKVDTEEGRALSRKASVEAAVLLKNDAHALPLAEDEKLLLMGPFAEQCPMDWYSGITSHQVTLAEGLRDHLVASESFFPYVRIRFGDGTYAGVSGTELRKVDASLAEVFRIMLWDDRRITIRSTSNGKLLTTHRQDQKILNVETGDREAGFYLDKDHAFSWLVKEAFYMYDENEEILTFSEEAAIRFWEDRRIRGIRNVDRSLELTFETVKDVDMILQELPVNDGFRPVCYMGLHPIVNGKEERDRTTIALPPFQQVLLRKIRKQYPGVILLLHTNSPIGIEEEKEAQDIPAILWMATGSEELGNAMADVLFGKVSPAGRLSQTWYRNDEQLPDIEDYDIEKNKTTYLYMEDKPLFRFGYGLSYTDFVQEITGTDRRDVTVKVQNTGETASDVVVQVYKESDGSYSVFDTVKDPGSRLSGFARLKNVLPGETREITIGCRY